MKKEEPYVHLKVIATWAYSQVVVADLFDSVRDYAWRSVRQWRNLQRVTSG